MPCETPIDFFEAISRGRPHASQKCRNPVALELVATFGGAMTFHGGTTGEGHSTQG